MTDRFFGKRVTIVGLAREGSALARYLTDRGAIVTISDSRPPAALGDTLRRIADLPVHLVLGANRVEDAIGADALFLSPGVPPTVPMVVAARAAGVPILSEPRLVLERCPAPIVGITGSSGKTTTTALTGAMTAASGRRTWVGGNIGRPLIGRIDEMTAGDAVVMELSSFQLETFDASPPVAVVTNLSPDHLDRHASLAEYYDAKRNIVRFQRPGDIAILNADSAEVRAFAEGLRSEVRWFSLTDRVGRGAFVEDDAIWLAGPDRAVLPIDELRLPGRHNLANALAAAAAADALGMPIHAIAEACQSFVGVKNRLETIATIDGVGFVNDSIATSPRRAVAALEAFDGPVRWLAGGRGKQLPLDDLPAVAASRPVTAYLFGEAAGEIGDALQAAGATVAGQFGSMADAFTAAAEDAMSGDTVLLSPACTSFDEFRDYEARGQAFRDLAGRRMPAGAAR